MRQDGTELPVVTVPRVVMDKVLESMADGRGGYLKLHPTQVAEWQQKETLALVPWQIERLREMLAAHYLETELSEAPKEGK